jgi:hypothetical protein
LGTTDVLQPIGQLILVYVHEVGMCATSAKRDGLGIQAELPIVV